MTVCSCSAQDTAGNTLHRPGCSANRPVVGVVVPAPGTGRTPLLFDYAAVPRRELEALREALRLCVEALALLGTGARVPVRVIRDALAAAQAVGVEPGGAKKETT